MDFLALPLLTLRLVLLVAGLLVPGALFLRALRLPRSLAGSLAGSAAFWYLSVLLLTLIHVQISLVALLVVLVGCAALCGLWEEHGRLADPMPTPEAVPFRLGALRGWLSLYLAFWGIVLWRLAVNPLSGPDVSFRWNYLAEQMLRFGSLDFYPPLAGADFYRYFWAESIPPGVASLYTWAYACGGSTNAFWAAPVVALQLLSLHELLWRLAAMVGGESAARWALLLGAACPLLTWSCVLGQETGLLAVGACGLVWCLAQISLPDGARWAVLGAVFAVVASSSREYGSAFAAAAAGVVLVTGAPRKIKWLFLGLALPLSFAWLLRTWIRTGNPFYSLRLGDLFPVNAVFVAWNDLFRAPQRVWFSTPATWLMLARYLLLWALPACVGLIGLAVVFRRVRARQIVLVFVALGILLWRLSVPYTAGGLFYTLRVLSPVFALLVLAAAAWAARLDTYPRAARILGLIAAVVLLESLAKTLLLPENPYRLPPREWFAVNRRPPPPPPGARPLIVEKVEQLPHHPRRIAADDYNMPLYFVGAGIEVAPIWSPDLAWLFDASLTPDVTEQRRQASGLAYLVLRRDGPALGLVNRSLAPHWRLRVAGQTAHELILQITPAAP
jgi:hypothetical protein